MKKEQLEIMRVLFKIFHKFHDLYDAFWVTYVKWKIYAFCKVSGRIKIDGRMFFYVARGAEVIIGKNLRIINSPKVNSLCTKITSIWVGKNAKLTIGDNVGMSSITLCITNSIKIGNNVNFGAGCMVFDTDFHSLDYLNRRAEDNDADNTKSAPVIIDNDAFIGANSMILKGVHIGCRSIVGAGSVVVKNIPDDCVVAGNPARIIRQNCLN